MVIDERVKDIFKAEVNIQDNFIFLTNSTDFRNQNQTTDAFTEKWEKYEKTKEKDKLYQMQREWYLKLYGFKDEQSLAAFLQSKKYIFDAGCGLGYKAKWFADLAPEAIVIGMDISEASYTAAQNYKDTKNLYFITGDIADTLFRSDSFDYVSCDQVIMHTEFPEITFKELARVTKKNGGEFACYVYAKKALPRELLDDYFRVKCKDMRAEEIWQMSDQLAELGKRLSKLNVTFESPDIPSLGIKGGVYDIQRFIYWNFIKCFWNEELGWDTSVVTNFDWYSPSNAKRYSENEFKKMIADNKLTILNFHSEEACFSGRFQKA